jgi:hypothetical protein
MYRQNNKNKINKYHKQLRFDLKIKAFDAYGGRRCSWCGETDIIVLTIDHINNNGSRHLDKGGYRIQGSRIYTWLKVNHYPSGFQILCINCNFAKSFYGVIPTNRKNLCR